MTYHSNQVEDCALPLPITQTAKQIAQRFASTQPTPQKAEQVRLNTLAVCVVNDYLQMMSIPTDLSVSDSWNSVMRLCADVADLEVIGVGRLECRPVSKHQSTCYIPPEVWSDRIGYVVVEIDESSSEAIVLGFSQTADIEDLPISQLRSPEDLIDQLHLSPSQPPLAAVPATVFQRTRVNLSQWLTNQFETGWQTLETLLNPAEPDLAFSFRSADSAVLSDVELPDLGVRRAKRIDWGMPTASPVVLVVEVIPESEQRKNITLQVHPTDNQTYLPPQLQLTVLDENGLVFLEALARSADNYIQLQFSGLAGEVFSVKVALGETSTMEDFVV